VLRVQDGAPGLDPSQVTARQSATWSRMLATDDLTLYVATDAGGDGEVVGIVTLLVMPNLGYDCHPSAFIEAMVVAEPHRRRGVGRLLVERLLADAAAASCRKVQLLTHKRHAHDGAHAFYRALGFEAEAEGFRLYLDPAG
jgi:GNAT superfamily N-acetyltransferase